MLDLDPMAIVDSTIFVAVAVVIGLLLTVSAVTAIAMRALRQTPCYADKRRRSQWKVQGQQLESRQLLDGAMGNEALALEGESITVHGVTYDNVDLKALAKAIADSGAIFFGADWCPHCTRQKGMFGDGAADLPFVEVTNPNHTLNQVGSDNNITQLPTWVFADGTRVTGVLEIEELLDYTGLTIPQGEPLYFAEIPDQTGLISGQSYHVALDGYSPSGQPLTYTVTSSSGTVIASVMQGNKSLRIYTSRFGTMEFYLFEQEAGRATSRIIELAESGFYDGLTFHRVFQSFVLQGGDPNGNGTGGSSLPDFKDQFNPNLRHNGTGILSYAKSFDDTNDSQFFIMEGIAPHLDFQHTVFGYMTEGEVVRESISGTPTGSNNLPQWQVVMDEVSTFVDLENGVLRLKIPEGASGTETITVTVSDGQGHTLSRSFDVTYASNENYTSNPYLAFVPDIAMTPGSSHTFQLTATNLDGDELIFYDQSDFDPQNDYLPAYAPNGLVYSVDSSTGLLQVNASAGLAPGVYKIVVAVSNDLDGEIISGLIDYDVIQVTVANRPVLNQDFVNLNEDGSVTFNPLTNDTDSASTLDPASFRFLSQPSVGEVSYDRETGEVTYTPPADFHGTASFQYDAANEFGIYGTPATVTLTVAPINDEPEALDDVFLADRDTATLLPVLKNDDKGPGEANTTVLITLASNATAAGGTVVVVGDNVQYTPAANFTGSDTFTYTIDDDGMESTATVTVDVGDVSNFTITAVRDLTDTGGDSIVDSRPQSDEIIGEWDAFWLEVWITPDGTGGDTVTAASSTLNFDSSIYRATSIVIDSTFTAASGSGVNNGSGTATINVTSSGVTLAAGERIRIGRVRFEPVANGLDAPEIGETLGVDFNTFLTSMTGASLTVDGVGVVNGPTTDVDLPVRLLPMVYDLNDDGKVGVVDFSIYINTIVSSNSSSFVDFDLSGDMYGSGFSFFRSAFGDTHDGVNHAFVWSPVLLKAAMSDMILTTHINVGSSAQSLSTEDVATVTTALPPSVITSSIESDTNVVTIHIVDLPGTQLASTIGNSIYLDANAAGWGWFVDSTPLDSSEFSANSENGRLLASSASAASGKIDLLSVLMHELGHVAGLEHTTDGLMSATISPGERLIDWDQDAFEESFYVSAVDLLFGSEED
ncbi:putative peptidyl-prolyl cis-trans isomerase [Bremerella volcania]|uniref:peptidylprolyl isomerase n=1 Tax=Bremerella volcania TaxID=2527984 RepID=A0A518C740_9BACT|nr:peptidylprolyl isomerase [Bremerella volcania]QDU75022.1 putative peptidyl-prolyl cis-trans isomerase [Bremerella volcania]